MSKAAEMRRKASRSTLPTTPGSPQAYPSNGSLVPTAPKHRVTHPKSASRLRPFNDYMPAPENRLPGQHWSKPADRDWRGKNIGCYHGTSHNGKAVLCEGAACKFAPPVRRGRSGSSESPGEPRVVESTVRAHLRALGYTGPVTSQLRTLVADALEFERQCAEMAE